MIQAEQFLKDHAQRAKRIDSPQAKNQTDNHAELPQEIRDAALRGWKIFPILTGSLRAPVANAMIDRATSNLSNLENLLSACPFYGYAVQCGPKSGIFAIEMRDPRSASILYRLAGITPQNADEEWDGLTLLARGAGSTFAFFKWPQDASSMIRLDSESNSSLILHGDGSWVPLPPSSFNGSTFVYLNCAEVSEPPKFLSDLLFERSAVNLVSADAQRLQGRPTHSESLLPLRRNDVVGKERKTVQFEDPITWRGKSGVTRRR